MEKTQRTKKKKVFIWATEHADLVWRRCFDRDFVYKGQNFVSYADLEGFFIMDNVELAEKNEEYRFTVESVAMLKKFLEHHPEYEEKIDRLIKNGQLEMPFTGNNIVDSNMVNGESIIRNYLYGREYLKEKYNYVPYNLDRNDAFGNSAQLPQIARGFGSKWITHIAYSNPDNLYWRGLDGSTVLVWSPKGVGYTGGYYKYRPCPVCNGFKTSDCSACNNRRIDLDFMESMRVKLPDALSDFDDTIPGQIYAGGEEILPKQYVIDWAKEHADKYDIEFCGFDHYIPYIQDMIDKVDEVGEDMIHSSREINCNNTGTFVTRINTKKTVRENENRLLSLEALSVAGKLNNGEYKKEKIESIWEKYFFTIFHDAVPATHVDPAYDEIMDCAKEIKDETTAIKNEILSAFTKTNENTVTVYNPYGSKVSTEATVTVKTDKNVNITDENGKNVTICDYKKENDNVTVTFLANDVGAFSKKVFNIVKTDEEFEKEEKVLYDYNPFNGKPVLTNEQLSNVEDKTQDKETFLENDRFKVVLTDNGIKEIFDKKLNKTIAKASEYMVGEFILEHDEGSPWSTHSPDMRRQPQARDTRLYKITKTKDTQTATFRVHSHDIAAYAVMGVKIIYSITLKNGSDKVHFSTDVFWHTQNYRLRIALPVGGEAKHLYDIPYGVIERKPYKDTILFEDTSTNWASAAGDYPAIHWAGVEKEDYSLALFNRGTPSYMIDKDKNGDTTMFLTVLRSPSLGSYLYSPTEYSMTDYYGMMDSGEHHFDFAIKAYDKGFSENDAVLDGIAYNSQTAVVNGELNIPELPQLLCNDARISSIKTAQNKKGIIVRINEYHGKDTKGTLVIPENIVFKAVYETDLKEDKTKNLTKEGNKIELDIRHFEIKTVYIEL